MKESKKNIIAQYVVDNIMIGSPEATDEAVEQLKKDGLVLKVMESAQDYLSLEIQFSDYEMKALLGEPFMIKSLEKKFDEQVMKDQSPKTPGMPKFLIVRPIVDAENLSVEDQKLFQSRMGIIQYPVKHSRPDIANAT